mgnify:CR=1 FL=1
MTDTKIKNIIFDLGNTLVYFDFNYFYDGVARLEKKLNPAAMKRFISEKKLADKLCKGTLNHKEYFRILKKKFNLKIGFNDFIYLYCDIFWSNNSMKGFLEKLSRTKRFRLYLLSNVDSYHINFIDKNFPFVRLLKNRVLSYKTGSIKPQRKIFLEALRKFRINREETVLIDDMKDNCESARKIGINAIQYKSHKVFLNQFTKIIKQN